MENIIPLLALAVALIICVILREFWCWYFKINDMHKTQQSIHNRLLEISEKLDKMRGPRSVPVPPSDSNTKNELKLEKANYGLENTNKPPKTTPPQTGQK